jgi:hypothetical protein
MSSHGRSRCKVVASEQVGRWYRGLNDREALSIKRAIDALAAEGRALESPRSGPIFGSRHRGMCELRSVGGNLRVLYAFDRGRAVLLVGGDKTGRWKGWYRRAIKSADRLFDRYTGGSRQWRTLRTGRRFEMGGR